MTSDKCWVNGMAWLTKITVKFTPLFTIKPPNLYENVQGIVLVAEQDEQTLTGSIPEGETKICSWWFLYFLQKNMIENCLWWWNKSIYTFFQQLQKILNKIQPNKILYSKGYIITDKMNERKQWIIPKRLHVCLWGRVVFIKLNQNLTLDEIYLNIN